MGETLSIERIGRTPTTAIELVYSPDDGGYYLSQTDFQQNRNRVSAEVYPTDDAARADWHAGKVDWEDWY